MNNDTLTRIYLISDNLTNTELLVRAPDRHKALRYAVASRFEVKLASQDDLEEMLTAGMRVQRATDPDEEPEADDVTAGLFDDEEQSLPLP